jgi:neutral ceramidase
VLLASALALGLALAACGGNAAPSPYDDDRARLAHCTFEPPPVRAPRPAPAPAPVQAGVGERVIPLPVGAPLGGYGARLTTLGGARPVDGRAARFATVMVPSVGLHDAPRVQALALAAGDERLVIVRADVPLVVAHALYALEQAIAPDGSMRGRVILAASHSHASWAGWLPSYPLVPGMDRPREELFRRFIDAAAGAARDALAGLAPARLGVTVVDGFDPGDAVSTDRRRENDTVAGPDGNRAGAGKDPIAWVLRVDHADAAPLAVVVDVAVHGTVTGAENLIVSTDVPGAIARALEARLGAPVLHLQGAAGDVAPAGPAGRSACPDAARCLDLPRLEALGARAAAALAPVVGATATSDTWALEVVTRSFPIGKSVTVERPDGTRLGYAPYDPARAADGRIFDEGGRLIPLIDEFNVADGALLCGEIGGSAIFPIDGLTGSSAYSSCLSLDKGLDAERLLLKLPEDVPAPFCETVRATVTAARLAGGAAGDWLLVTLPGEPTAPLAAYLRGQSPAGPERTLLVGYGSDHAGYLLTAEDWLAGGYEPSVNLWGPLEGEQVVAGALAAAALAWTPEREDPERGSSRVVDFRFPADAPVAPVVTTDHGTVPAALPALFLPDTTAAPITAQPEAQIPRAVGAARFVWLGGDPAVDLPEVLVEREVAGGVFEPLTGAHGRPASSRDGVVVLTYTPDPIGDAAPAHHYWTATWQAVPPDPLGVAPGGPFALPLGRYRLRATGTAQTATGPAAYTVASAPFEIVAAPLAGASVARDEAGLHVVAGLGGAPGLRALRDGVSDADLPLVIAAVTVGLADGTTVEATPQDEGEGRAFVALAPGTLAAAVSVDVRDAAGNGGVVAVE